MKSPTGKHPPPPRQRRATWRLLAALLSWSLAGSAALAANEVASRHGWLL